MKFCHLEKDQKTFRLILMYLEHFKYNSGSCLKLDNTIQWEEIKHHLYINGMTEDNQQEIHKWIAEHSQSFRSYLNTVKIAAMVLLSQGMTKETLSWECYCDMEDQLNLLKENCLDSIY